MVSNSRRPNRYVPTRLSRSFTNRCVSSSGAVQSMDPSARFTYPSSDVDIPYTSLPMTQYQRIAVGTIGTSCHPEREARSAASQDVPAGTCDPRHDRTLVLATSCAFRQLRHLGWALA